jgi:hypothetical protein
LLSSILSDFKIPSTLKQVEPNDDLAIIADYFLSRYTALTRVMFIPGVPLDTNYVERAIKAIIRIRLNSLFFENLESAKYSGEILSVLETTNLNKINAFIYIEFLITNKEKVIKNPKNYLPWLYDKDDAYKKLYWKTVALKNRRPSNSPEYPKILIRFLNRFLHVFGLILGLRFLVSRKVLEHEIKSWS